MRCSSSNVGPVPPKSAFGPKAPTTKTPPRRVDQSTQRCIVTLPKDPRSVLANGMATAVWLTSRASHEEEHIVGQVICHFFEQIANLLAQGVPIHIRGFGRFALKWRRGQKGGHGHAMPVFILARGLRQEVMGVLKDQVDAYKHKRFRTRNARNGVPGRIHERASLSMQQLRKQMSKDHYEKLLAAHTA